MPHKRARVDGHLHAREVAHDVRRAPLAYPEFSPEAALLSIESLRAALVLLPRDFLKVALARWRSIVCELAFLVEAPNVGNSSGSLFPTEPEFDPV